MKSMTGYGRAEGMVAGKPFAIEIRCLNHRYRDVRLSLPRGWLALEVDVERRIRQCIGRGRVECSVRPTGAGNESGMPVLDEQRALAHAAVYRRLAALLDLPDAPPLELLAQGEGVIAYRSEETAPEAIRADLLPLLDEALAAADAMRCSEGERLGACVVEHLRALDEHAGRIERVLPQELSALQQRTAQRIRALAADCEVASERLDQELAVLAERADVSEELDRLRSHRAQFSALLERAGPIGRELDFLVQEMNREVNTLCAKFHSADVVRTAVAAKAELEKLREQIQNLE